MAPQVSQLAQSWQREREPLLNSEKEIYNIKRLFRP